MGKIDYEPIQDNDKWPVCPHCEKEIRKVSYFEQSVILRLKFVCIFVCPHCFKVLGASIV